MQQSVPSEMPRTLWSSTCIYDELIDTVEESRRSADQGLRFDKYDTGIIVIIDGCRGFYLLPVLLR